MSRLCCRGNLSERWTPSLSQNFNNEEILPQPAVLTHKSIPNPLSHHLCPVSVKKVMKRWRARRTGGLKLCAAAVLTYVRKYWQKKRERGRWRTERVRVLWYETYRYHQVDSFTCNSPLTICSQSKIGFNFRGLLGCFSRWGGKHLWTLFHLIYLESVFQFVPLKVFKQISLPLRKSLWSSQLTWMHCFHLKPERSVHRVERTPLNHTATHLLIKNNFETSRYQVGLEVPILSIILP